MRKFLSFLLCLLLTLCVAFPVIAEEAATEEAPAVDWSAMFQPPVIEGPYEIEETAIEFESAGVTLRGTLSVPVTDEAQKFPGVVLTHGFTSNQNDCANMATALAKNGFVTVRFNNTGSGDSDGNYADTTFTSQANDVLAALAYIKTLDCVDTNNLFLSGKSQGGVNTAMAAVDCEEEINAIVLWFPAFCIPTDFANGRVQFAEFDLNNIPETLKINDNYSVGRGLIEEGLAMDPEAICSAFEKDVLILQGDSDFIVNLSFAQEVAGYYPNAELIVVEGGGHGFFGESETKSLNDMVAFFKAHLK